MSNLLNSRRIVHPRRRVLLTNDVIMARLKTMASWLTSLIKESPDPVVLVTVQTGGTTFAEALKGYVGTNLFTSAYVHTRRYEEGETEGGEIRIEYDPVRKVRGRTIVLLDDVCDGSDTLIFLGRNYRGRGARQVVNCVLTDKPSGRTKGVTGPPLHCVGFESPDQWLFGFGMDGEREDIKLGCQNTRLDPDVCFWADKEADPFPPVDVCVRPNFADIAELLA